MEGVIRPSFLFCAVRKEHKQTMANETILTAEGVRELEERLEYMKTVTRKEIAEQIKEARGFGDLSENAE